MDFLENLKITHLKLIKSDLKKLGTVFPLLQEIQLRQVSNFDKKYFSPKQVFSIKMVALESLGAYKGLKIRNLSRVYSSLVDTDSIHEIVEATKDYLDSDLFPFLRKNKVESFVNFRIEQSYNYGKDS